MQTSALGADALDGSQAGNLMTVANQSTPTLTNAMASGDLSTKLQTGLDTTASAAGAVGETGLASNLSGASDASGDSIAAYQKGDLVNSIGSGTTAVALAS